MQSLRQILLYGIFTEAPGAIIKEKSNSKHLRYQFKVTLFKMIVTAVVHKICLVIFPVTHYKQNLYNLNFLLVIYIYMNVHTKDANILFQQFLCTSVVWFLNNLVMNLNLSYFTCSHVCSTFLIN